MTTARLVFVNHKFYEEAFKSFDIPFALITKEKFKQPIFGSNYIEGKQQTLFSENYSSRIGQAFAWTTPRRLTVLSIFQEGRLSIIFKILRVDTQII